MGHCWRSLDKLISNVLLWTPMHGLTSVGWPARTYVHQLCADTGCNLEDLVEVMDVSDEWQERIGGTLCYKHNLMISYLFLRNYNDLVKCKRRPHINIIKLQIELEISSFSNLCRQKSCYDVPFLLCFGNIHTNTRVISSGKSDVKVLTN